MKIGSNIVSFDAVSILKDLNRSRELIFPYEGNIKISDFIDSLSEQIDKSFIQNILTMAMNETEIFVVNTGSLKGYYPSYVLFDLEALLMQSIRLGLKFAPNQLLITLEYESASEMPNTYFAFEFQDSTKEHLRSSIAYESREIIATRYFTGEPEGYSH